MTRDARKIALAGTLALTACLAPRTADAQHAGTIARIGVLFAEEPASPAFLQGLRELGYVPDQDIAIEPRSAKQYERFPDLAAELVRLKVDVIVSFGTLGTQAAMQATKTIPIVMVGTGNPVGTGLVVSLARPGGNVTGLSFMSTELSGKRLELIKEAVPGLSRMAVLGNPANPTWADHLKVTSTVALQLAVKLQLLEARGASEFESAFATIGKGRAQALCVLPDLILLHERSRLLGLVAEHRLPAIYPAREFVDAGGLMSYGANIPGLWHRAAYYVDKILKGAKPADLPIEQPTKFELVVNLKTARALGLTIPESILLRADEVIR
jgi:ABC-type uncharacterized transport system substrate-binding protein